MRLWLPERSWSQIRELILSRRVQVNGNVSSDAQRVLKAAEVVRVGVRPAVPPVRADDVRLVHVDEHLVVVDKPPGVTTLRHAEERNWSPERKNREPTLDEWISKRLRDQAGPAPRKTRAPRENTSVRAVHRLDRDTSGLMVFARTPETEAALIRQFSQHTVERAYIAIAAGRVPAATHESYFVRDRGDGLRGSTSDPQGEGAQKAVTHVEPLESLRDFTVVQCRLETGRTHQIRIHLAEAGHPVVGEKVYTSRRDGQPYSDLADAPRQMLHAAVLGFIHPAKKQLLQFLSPLPRDMQRVLDRLRGAT